LIYDFVEFKTYDFYLRLKIYNK